MGASQGGSPELCILTPLLFVITNAALVKYCVTQSLAQMFEYSFSRSQTMTCCVWSRSNRHLQYVLCSVYTSLSVSASLQASLHPPASLQAQGFLRMQVHEVCVVSNTTLCGQ